MAVCDSVFETRERGGREKYTGFLRIGEGELFQFPIWHMGRGRAMCLLTRGTKEAPDPRGRGGIIGLHCFLKASATR